MQLDPGRGADLWLESLTELALHSWGADRVRLLEPNLRRMAEALSSIGKRAPQADTLPDEPKSESGDG